MHPSSPHSMSPNQLASQIQKRESFVLSHEDVLKKRAFLSDLDSLSPGCAPVVFKSIIRSLFAFARDINPFIRLKALFILSTSKKHPLWQIAHTLEHLECV
jgi:hypothetical protein